MINRLEIYAEVGRKHGEAWNHQDAGIAEHSVLRKRKHHGKTTVRSNAFENISTPEKSRLWYQQESTQLQRWSVAAPGGRGHL